MTDHDARQRAALLRLVAQPTGRDKRPCPGCVSPCRCPRRSPFCGCCCGPSCLLVPRMLSRDPERPLHDAFVELLYELAVLRLIVPAWPERDYYCRPPDGSRPPVLFRSDLFHAELLSHHLSYLDAVGELSARWLVSIVAHLAGTEPCSFAIEPSGAASAARLRADLGRIGRRLSEHVHRIARVRLAASERGRPHASSRLTRRESEILDLFLAGLGVDTIADRLFISPHTVRNHMKRLFAKFGVASQRELRERFAEGHRN